MQHHSQVVSQALRAFRYRNHSHQRSMKQFGLALRFYIVWFFRFFFYLTNRHRIAVPDIRDGPTGMARTQPHNSPRNLHGSGERDD